MNSIEQSVAVHEDPNRFRYIAAVLSLAAASMCLSACSELTSLKQHISSPPSATKTYDTPDSLVSPQTLSAPPSSEKVVTDPTPSTTEASTTTSATTTTTTLASSSVPNTVASAEQVSPTTTLADSSTTSVQSSQQTLPEAACIHPQGPFTVEGNKVLDGNGQPFFFTGTTGFSLAMPDWEAGNDDAAIEATADSTWCGNNFRIQVSEDNAVGPDDAINSSYVNAITSEVHLAESLGLVAIISDNTEHTGGTQNPTTKTLVLWQALAKTFGSDPNVIDEPFNEPRLLGGSPNRTLMWSLWRNGGTFNDTEYIGMDTLVTDLRQDPDVHNTLLWVDGPNAASTLSELPEYPINGSGVVLAAHHPEGIHTVYMWKTTFGNEAEIAPVVISEFNMSDNRSGVCWSDAQTQLPALFSYINAQPGVVGFNAWSLEVPGTLAQGSDLNDPTTLGPDFNCQTTGLGDGQLVMREFNERNRSSA
jgi:hypothetical protein